MGQKGRNDNERNVYGCIWEKELTTMGRAKILQGGLCIVLYSVQNLLLT